MMHRRIGLLAAAAVVAASSTAALASSTTTAGAESRSAVAKTSDALSTAAAAGQGQVLRRIVAAARVDNNVSAPVSAASVASAAHGVHFAAVSLRGLSGRARDAARRWNSVVHSGAVAASQRQVAADAGRLVSALEARHMAAPASRSAASGIVPCTVQTADTVLLVAFFVEVDAVFIPQNCGANVSCLKTNEVAAIEAQEFFVVILTESDVNCFLFG